MTRYVALLRGINVGGNKKVSMNQLKTVFEDLDLKNVSTYINSGNVIFDNPDIDTVSLKNKIEKSLAKSFGFEIKIIIRDYKNISKICTTIPIEWKNDESQKTDIIFLWDDYCHKDSLNLIKVNTDVDNLMYIDGAIVWNIRRKDYKRSGMHKFMGTELYKNMTARNINTVRKLHELMGYAL